MTMNSSTFKNFDKSVDVTTSLAKVAAFDVRDSSILTVVVKNTGSQPLNAFRIDAKVTRWEETAGLGSEGQDVEYTTIKQAGYTESDFYVISSTKELITLPAGASALLVLNVSLLDFVRFYASGASATTLKFYASEWQGNQ